MEWDYEEGGRLEWFTHCLTRTFKKWPYLHLHKLRRKMVDYYVVHTFIIKGRSFQQILIRHDKTAPFLFCLRNKARKSHFHFLNKSVSTYLNGHARSCNLIGWILWSLPKGFFSQVMSALDHFSKGSYPLNPLPDNVRGIKVNFQ